MSSEFNGKVCIACGAPLTGRQQKYCSRSCKEKCYYQKVHHEPKNEFCIVCGAPLPKGRIKYCSKTCSMKNFRSEHKDYYKDYNKRWYQENKERVTENKRRYNAKHREQNRAYYYRKKYGIEYEKFEEPLWLDPTCEDCLYYEECGGKKTDCEFRV